MSVFTQHYANTHFTVQFIRRERRKSAHEEYCVSPDALESIDPATAGSGQVSDVTTTR
jgi:hypothetical protein